MISCLVIILIHVEPTLPAFAWDGCSEFDWILEEPGEATGPEIAEHAFAWVQDDLISRLAGDDFNGPDECTER